MSGRAAPPPDPRFEQLGKLFQQRRHADLEKLARDLLRQHPKHPGLWKALGVALTAQGRHADAISAKRQAVQLAPRDPESRLNLGNSLLAEGLAQEAIDAYRAAAELAPKSAEAWKALARAFSAARRPQDALKCLAHLVKLMPESADAHNELGNQLREMHRMKEAEVEYRRALVLDPSIPATANNLANALVDLGHVEEAERYYHQAIARKGAPAHIHSNLGNLLKEQGRLAEAQASYRKALEQDPKLFDTWSNLILSMNNDPAMPIGDAVQEARRFGQALQARIPGPLAMPGPRRNRPLEVGFFSGDLRQHPVGYFLEGWLPHVDPARVRMHAYATTVREDALSARLRQHVAGWHVVQRMRDDAVARLVHSHGIDVLFDLSGHTAYNRLEVFAWRPAPVQATWLGYFATTGVPAIDWLLADEASVPAGGESQFTERVWRMPHTRLCFSPPRDAPPVAPAPALRNGFVTFGSFQNLAKVHAGVLQAWARVLAAVPGSRLRLHSPQLSDVAAQKAFATRFGTAGIDPSRVKLLGKVPRKDYLAAHAEVDLLLDTFPFPGGTTTCEALWMGVPTVTLEGSTLLTRQGAALLRAAGLPQFIAPDVDGYVRMASAFAADIGALQALREGLRDRLPRTPLFDAKAFAGDWMDAVEGMAASPVA